MKLKMHGNGFMRLYLDDGRRFIHIYSDDFPRQLVLTDIHDHRFEFESHVLQGKLDHFIFVESEGNEFDIYAPNSSDKLVFTERTCDLRPLGYRLLERGDVYRVPVGMIHKVQNRGTTVTEVVKQRVIEDYQPKIYVPHGQLPDNKFDNLEHAL